MDRIVLERTFPGVTRFPMILLVDLAWNEKFRAKSGAAGAAAAAKGELRAAQPALRPEQTPGNKGPAGISSGVHHEPGADDDGWIVPPPVKLPDGTHLRLHKDGEALHAAYDAIKRARRRVGLEVYIFHSDDTGRAFADLLCQKARDGVAVFLIYDSFGSSQSDPAMFRKMRQAGVRMQEFHPIAPWNCKFGWRPVNRDHRKLLVIDDNIAGMGGLNIGAEYAGSWIISRPGPCEHWRDSAVGIIGPGARPFFKCFANTWRYCVNGGRIYRAAMAHNLDFTEGDIGLLASVPTVDSPLRANLHRLIRGARKSLLLTMAYFAPDDDLIDELCRAARRGVRVRLMLPGKCDVKLVWIAARSFYETLLSAGIQVYERQSVVLHAKTMVIDDRTTVIGSTNLDYRSIEYNCELSAVVRSTEFGAQMRALFENDVKYARRITLDKWRYRPTWDRFVQWAVSRARYLL